MENKEFCKAELKVCKFRETLTSNVDGNPEPSPENREGAETRHRLCLHCGEPISLMKFKSARYCSSVCGQKAANLRRVLKRGGKAGIGSGNNQWGTNNHMYKTGIGTFKRIAYAAYGKICNRCGSITNIVVHHIDEDRTNNTKENLEVLCKRCHQNHHCVRDTVTGKYLNKSTKV